uniref:DH domain-containing protein n=1 Tax=Panagrellus redivivus TaxID=6233 RepID=A0A7E4UY86_PANRE
MTSSTDCVFVKKHLWSIHMPQGSKHTCAALTNDVYQGYLHMYMRHSIELEPHVPGLRRLRLQLPYSMRTLLRRIGQAPSMEAADSDVQKFSTHLSAEYETLMEVQRLIQKFLQRVVTSSATPTTTKTDDSTRIEYPLPSGKRCLVLAVSDWVDPPLRKSSDRRHVQKIITAFTTR